MSKEYTVIVTALVTVQDESVIGADEIDQAISVKLTQAVLDRGAWVEDQRIEIHEGREFFETDEEG